MAGSAGGPFVGLYQGSSGASDASAALAPLLPGISVYQQGASTAPQLQAQVTTPPVSSPYGQGGNMAKFAHFLGGVAAQTGQVAEGAASWLATNAVNFAEAPYKAGEGIAKGLLDQGDLNNIRSQSNQLTGQLTTLSKQFQAGTINRQQYQQGMRAINDQFSNLDKQSTALSSRVTLDKNTTTKATIDTASGLFTILTAGFGAAANTALRVGEGGISLEPMAAKSAADWLASKAAAPLLEPVAGTINKLATDSTLFKGLDSVTQNILQRATAEAVAQGGTMTAGQIARATAVNVALKYPIYFNYMSTTANQVYQELDQQKYGDAIRQLAFNAALLLSGGPIGAAMKYGGKALKGLNERTFGQTSFWDELSKFYGDQTTSGFALSITKMAATMGEEERAQFIKDLSAVEATNVGATGGDAVAAAARLAKGEQAKNLTDLSQVSHEAALTDMVKMIKNFRNINDTATKLGLGPIAVGRFDVRSKSLIAKTISGPEDMQGRLKAWEDLKAQNPNDALANNANLDAQVRNAIVEFHDNPAQLESYIMSIKAATTIEGFPQSILDAAAKDGYIPIRPKNLQAPFAEGSGTLLTSAKDASGATPELFMRSVQPLPVLTHVGSLFTSLGLSPNASTARVYSYFADSLGRNLLREGAIREMPTETLQETSDMLVKKLSNFAHEQKVPVMDLRMLTRKQIMSATRMSKSDAAGVARAIVKSYTDVPLAVRGMGEAAVDWSYRLPAASPIVRRYLKIQGALRFSFNPFFQYLRVIPKTEMLSTAEGGGYLRSIFQGRASQIEDIRYGLRAGGLLDTVGHLGSSQSGEAVEFMGALSKNINKKLLPMQERSIAGLIDAQAQRMGMQWQDYIKEYPHQAADTIQMIAEYDRKSNFLNSPLARTLNVAIFPFRFDMKVLTIFSRNLAKSDLLTQVSVVNGLMKAHAWLQGPEGQAWYKQNADAIGLFKYITPIASLSEAFQSLLPGNDHHLGNFGELGGLPFGWIPQLLDAEGLTQFNQPGVDAKTGKPFPEYVPVSARGQAAIAVQDLLSSLFSYPGAQVGLPSKGAITRNTAKGLTGAKTGPDLQLINMAADQQQYTPHSMEAQPTGTTTQEPTSVAPNLKAMKAAKATASPKTKAPKKADFTPVPAPGQSALGVL